VQAEDPLTAARTQAAARRWVDAITALKRLNASTNADWRHLMGYCQRKVSLPDLDAADRHYRKALRVAPAFRGGPACSV
jgi:Flp pilus assembly protein TadD